MSRRFKKSETIARHIERALRLGFKRRRGGKRLNPAIYRQGSCYCMLGLAAAGAAGRAVTEDEIVTYLRRLPEQLFSAAVESDSDAGVRTQTILRNLRAGKYERDVAFWRVV